MPKSGEASPHGDKTNSPYGNMVRTSPIVRQRLRPGAVRAHIKKGQSQAHGGVGPLSPLTHRNTGYQPLPPPLGLPPYHYDLTEHFPDIAQHIGDGPMVCDILGDSGGVKDGEFQDRVSAAMVKALENANPSQFCYHVGDVVYFTGAHDDYYGQFYEPYESYTPPIFSIPGNHDGEVDDPKAQTSLDGWVAYFMQKEPDVDPISHDAPRVGLNLPNPYWTFTTPLATFIGMYTNVPEHGSIDSDQQHWLTNEFHTAPEDRALILALHHPIYSFDVFHSGSSKMADALENAIRDTGRVPNLVLTGHVHDYQRIEQTIAPDSPTPFLVVGNGGYHNLHKIHSNNGDVAADTKAKLIYGIDSVWGYLKLTIDKKTIKGQSTEIDKNGNPGKGDSFSYPAGPIILKNSKSVPTL
ncbi:MAG TPA: metallophosphoesterase [Candidatus Sulfotelmatobacter sp.]|nr:metallophosphoesterase [Candidatus Sulfotelmatobacter sp.]